MGLSANEVAAFLPSQLIMMMVGVTFLSALAAAVCTVLYRPYLKKYPPLQVSGLGMVASVVFLALLAVPEDFFLSLPSFSPIGWLAVIFIGVSSVTEQSNAAARRLYQAVGGKEEDQVTVIVWFDLKARE